MLKSISTNAEYSSVEIIQDVTDGNWTDYTLSIVNKPPAVSFETDNTNTKLSVKDYPIATGNEVIIGNGTNVMRTVLGTVSSSTVQNGIDTASYSGLSFSVASQETVPYGIAFNSDGTRMFIVGYINKTVYQYNLSTPFSVNTASYSGLSFSVTSQDTAPYGIAFNSDGTRMFIVGYINDTVYQYNLSTPFSVNTASYSGLSFSVASQETSPYGIAFNSDGTRMFIVGIGNDTVYQYNLSTPFSVNTASYSGLSFSVASQEKSPYGIAFNSDGTRMFIVGIGNDTVYQYNLSTPFSVNTASYSGLSFSVASQETNPFGIAFNSDGTRMFIVGNPINTVYQYDLSGGLGSYTKYTSNISSLGFTAPTSLLIKTADMVKTMVSFSSEKNTLVDNYSIDGKVTSATATQLVYTDTIGAFEPIVGDKIKLYTSANPPTGAGVTVTITGVTKAVVGGNNRFTVTYANIGATPLLTYNPYTYSGLSFSVASQETVPYGIAFNSDGTRMFIVGYINKTVYQYNLSTPFSVNTASYSGLSFSVASQETVPYGIAFNSDGTRMFIVGYINDTVYQYNLSTPFSVNTASYSGLSFSVASQETSPIGIAFNSDGTRMFIVGNNNDTVYQYNLSTPFSVNTASYSGLSFSVVSQDANPYGIAFNSDGTRMFIVGNNNKTVYQYNLSTPFSVNTASYSGLSFSVTSQDTAPYGIAFNSDGTRMFIVGAISGKVYQYNKSGGDGGLFSVLENAEEQSLSSVVYSSTNIRLDYTKVVKEARALRFKHISPLVDDLVVSTTFQLNKLP